MRIFLILLSLVQLSFVQGQYRKVPYEINNKTIAVGVIGLSTLLAGAYIDKHQDELNSDDFLILNSNDINWFDRGAASNWNESLANLSDITRTASLVPPIVLFGLQLINQEWDKSLIYGTMYVDMMLATLGITYLTKNLVRRTRPYYYNAGLTVPEKEGLFQEGDVSDSFFSGHTSVAFASSVFFAKTFTDIYGKGPWSNVVWASSLSLAFATGILRYTSGHHYPSDVIVGALVGSAIGYLVPVLHKKENQNKNVRLTSMSNQFNITIYF